MCIVRLCKPGGADHGASPFCRGGDVRHPPRSEPHQRPPEAAALRLHRQRRRSPGLTHINRLLASKHTCSFCCWVVSATWINQIRQFFDLFSQESHTYVGWTPPSQLKHHPPAAPRSPQYLLDTGHCITAGFPHDLSTYYLCSSCGSNTGTDLAGDLWPALFLSHSGLRHTDTHSTEKEFTVRTSS